jgi:ABC-type Zn uptake system ZnuABC Zn-binding protein ZnuA
MPVDTDPHAFSATPRDVARLAGADLVLVNGLGLESFLGDLLSVAGTGRVVVVSRTITPRALAHGEEHGHHEGCEDPHVWFDPVQVQAWARVIGEELARRDPAQAGVIRERTEAYVQRLKELDTWARGRLAGLPAARRQLVTDHDAFGYFAGRYGFTIVGCVLPGFSSSAEASARDLARLHDLMRTTGVRSIFVEQAGNPAVARRLGEATGAELVALPTCSLSAAGGPAATYEAFFRHVVESVARSLER